MEATDGNVTKQWSLTEATNIQLGETMFLWFVQRRSFICGPILYEKALEMSNKMFDNP